MCPVKGFDASLKTLQTFKKIFCQKASIDWFPKTIYVVVVIERKTGPVAPTGTAEVAGESL